MNQAVIKYNKIDGNTPEGFKGSSTTIQEDIIAMRAPTAKRKRMTTSEKQNDNQKAMMTERKLPPFAKFTKVTNTPDSTYSRSVTAKLGTIRPGTTVIVQIIVTAFTGTPTPQRHVARVLIG